MKIYHLADLHLGSPMQQLGKKAEMRRAEVLQTFVNTVQRARSEGVKYILLCGDIFDNNRPKMKDKKQFYHIIQDFSDITFFYLRGNHDISQTYDRKLSNLKTFVSEHWTTYEIGNITVSGIELNSDNIATLDHGLILSPQKYNIVMLHGSLGNGNDNSIDIAKLKGKNINYIALGHYHSYQQESLDQKCSWAYSGCIEGRGYDEIGPKGYIKLDTVSNIAEFIPCCLRQVRILQIDISQASDIQDAINMVNDKIKTIPEKDLLKIELIGETNFPTNEIEERILRLNYKLYYLKVYNLTSHHISIEEYEKKNSLIGEFIRQVKNDVSLTDDQKQQIYQIGIDALT